MNIWLLWQALEGVESESDDAWGVGDCFNGDSNCVVSIFSDSFGSGATKSWLLMLVSLSA